MLFRRITNAHWPLSLLLLLIFSAPLASAPEENCSSQVPQEKVESQQSPAPPETYRAGNCPASQQDALTTLEQAIASETLAPLERSKNAYRLAVLAFDGSQEGQDKARLWLDKAEQWAKGDQVQSLVVRLGQTRLLPQDKQLAVLTGVFAEIKTLTASPEQAQLFLAVGEQADKQGASGLELAYHSLTLSVAVAGQSGDKPLSARTLGALGHLYESQNRNDEAVAITEEALSVIQDGQNHALLWPIDAQLGRLYHRQGQDADALAAYRRAVRHIGAIRQDLPVRYNAEGNSSFRETLAPVYQALADLLLSQTSENARNTQELLYEARDAIELSKQAELEDYLGERCAVESLRNELSRSTLAGTAVLYPLVLPDRLELLLETKGRLYRFPVAVGQVELKTATLNLVKLLRSPRRPAFAEESRRLYKWLVQPLEKVLQDENVKTLLMVPDDFLRFLPLAALYDGNGFLIERYALAISPALSVLSARHAEHRLQGKMLLAGLGKPPEDEPLPGVEKEIREIHSLYDSEMLLDEQFSIAELQKQLAKGVYSSVHIASHGEFEGDAKDTYIMAYDGKIRLDTLQAGLKKRQALELLSFSACQTAVGNDRSPLGLSGMAIKANSRAVIGTLWQVNDTAAEKIMTGFYRQYLQFGLGKAEAMRQAQLAWLQEQPGYRHPFYWSAFILVGDWL